MAELGTLARPYAKAAFEVALANGALADWSQQLALASELANSEAMQQVFSNPSLTSATQADLFNQVCGEKASAHLKNLVNALAENKRLPLFPAIAEQFEKLREEQEKTVTVEIRSAFPLDADQESRLIAGLKNKLARDVTANTVIDETLIGGVIVRAGDLVIDGSAKGRLAKLVENVTA